ncbi:MAG: ThuA domain-containing protein [Asticcacaulis sp.]
MTFVPSIHRRHFLTGLGQLGLGLTLAGSVAAAPARRLKILIVDGVSNHDWQMTTRCLRAILEPSGLFDISVSTSPPTADAAGWDAWRPRFSDYDAVIQTYNDYGGGPTWPEAVKADFETFVRKGGGVFVLHSGNNAFADWPAYNEIIGLGWRSKDYGTAVYIDDHEKPVAIPPGEGDNTGHGPRFDALVHRIGEHPVHKGLPRQWMTADVELYRYARGPAHHLKILTYALEPATQKNWPMEWMVNYGQGRVYIANYGHVWKGDIQPVTMRSADVQTLIPRILQWLSRVPVSYPLPADFPTATATSIRPELTLNP